MGGALGTTAATTGGAGAGTSASSTAGNTANTSGLKADAFGNVIDDTGAIVASGSGTGGGLSTGTVLGTTATGGTTAGLTGGASDAAISESVNNTIDKAYENAQKGAASNVSKAYAGAGAFAPPAGGNGILSKLGALSTVDKIRLASVLAGTIGGLTGGGSGTGGGGGTVPAGLGQLRSPLFNQQLTPLTPEQNEAKYGARDMTGTDWKTWGSRPATSFFNYVQQPTGMAHGGSFAAKQGGMKPRTQFAVSGPGTGRSDDIPAVLSDGEYVIDAETVALLGDGSSKAGAKKLDDLRVKVRKHKGKKLAQGRFSANAKNPEAYLSGGRA
jgi:hypothetical protein